jgi:hypothetical protein
MGVDLFALQVAVSPDLKNAASTLFAGISLEPLTGVGLGAGVIRSRADFLRAGYAEGMSAPANRDDYVVSKDRLVFYFGLSLGLELVHTTAAKAAADSTSGQAASTTSSGQPPSP